MSKANTRATINANIKQNGNQEITGQTLNSVLNTMVDDYAEQEKLTELELEVLGISYGEYLTKNKATYNANATTISGVNNTLPSELSTGEIIVIKHNTDRTITNVICFDANFATSDARIIETSSGLTIAQLTATTKHLRYWINSPFSETTEFVSIVFRNEDSSLLNQEKKVSNLESEVATMGTTINKLTSFSPIIISENKTEVFEIPDGSMVYGNNHVIDLGQHFVGKATQTNGVVFFSYSASTDEDIYKVFVTKELDVLADTSSNKGYNCTLWMSFEDRTLDKKLTPVLEYNAMLSTAESFFYDGSIVWINTGGASVKEFVLSQKDGFYLEGINASIQDLTIRYAKNEVMKVCNGASVRLTNVTFEYSGKSSNLLVRDANVYCSSCKSFKARFDGFGIDGSSGYSEFVNCEGYWNFDDGISHHNDGVTYIIMGGEYHHNKKGGVASPTYGSMGNIINVHSHHNDYGIYAVSNSRVDKPLIVNGCLLNDNKENLIATNMDVIMLNCVSVRYTHWADEVQNGTLSVYNSQVSTQPNS